MLHTLRGVAKKKSYWVLTVISSLYYFLFMAIAYFVQNTLNTMEATEVMAVAEEVETISFPFWDRAVWADQRDGSRGTDADGDSVARRCRGDCQR
ncbi:MAG: hypothetical protein R2688_01150 [Fimbriimonadaceae bacterium]